MFSAWPGQNLPVSCAQTLLTYNHHSTIFTPVQSNVLRMLSLLVGDCRQRRPPHYSLENMTSLELLQRQAPSLTGKDSVIVMPVSNKLRIGVFIGIALLSFTIWFADGYLQWVNSDIAAEAFGTSQNVAFPQGLISRAHPHHSRITGTLISYIPFHTVGYLYRELTNDPINALYVSQGVMSGTIFMLLVLISAAYLSTSAHILSVPYLVCAFLLMLFIMAKPVLPLDAPISLNVRFGHQAVMTNYVGTLVIALFALFPYWRYLFSGKWDDWYNDVKWRCLFYVVIIAAIFSSTATMVWLGTFAVFAFLSIIYSYVRRADRGQTGNYNTVYSLLLNTKTYPLIVIVTLCSIGILAESITMIGSSASSQFNIAEYIKVYASFFFSSPTIWYAFAFCLVLIACIRIERKQGKASSQLLVLASIFPWLVAGNLVFTFIIGMPRIPYRFSGYSLGPDTILAAKWSMALWLMAVIIAFWRENKCIWMAPLLIFILITNSLSYFTFHGYESKQQQKNIFSALHLANKNLPKDSSLPLPVENVAFAKDALLVHTVHMLTTMGIISPQRKISVVSKDDYESWYKEFTNKGMIPLLPRQDE
jgi:hypothetical protein